MVSLPGASGSGPFHVISQWVTAFQAIYPEAEITLSSIGSGATQRALWGDVDCDNKPIEGICDSSERIKPRTVWGIGDAPFKANDYLDHPDFELQQFPACAGAVLVTFSKDVLDSVANSDNVVLNLNFDAVTGIFNQTVSFWDDDAITSTNPGLQLPHQPITVVVRSDGSGQSDIFSSALQYNGNSWPEAATGKLPKWPLGELASLETHSIPSCWASDGTNITTQHFEADGKQGVALGLIRTPYSIGYLEMGYYEELSFFIADSHLSNREHPQKFARASRDTITATMDSMASTLDPVTLEGDLTSGGTDGGYPVSGYAYWYASRKASSYDSCYQAWLLCRLIEWSYKDPQAQSIASENGWISAPDSVTDLVIERLNEIMCLSDDGRAISARSYTPEAYREEKNTLGTTRAVAWALGAFTIVTSVAFTLWTWYYRNKHVVRASQPVFLVMICVGTFAMGAALFPLGIDDTIASVAGCNIACMSWVWLIPCGFTISFSALFSKIWRLNLIVQSSAQCRRLKIEVKDVLAPFLVLFGLNIAILLSWTLVDPLRWERVQTSELSSYGACRSDNNGWKYFLTAIVVVNTIALVAANVEAYKARRISDEFSESVYIAFCNISLLQALLLGLPLVVLVKENPSAKLFTYSGILFVACMSLLLLIFVPKMMYVRRNDKDNRLRRTQTSDNSGEGIRIKRIGEPSSDHSGNGLRSSILRKGSQNSIPVNFSQKSNMSSIASNEFEPTQKVGATLPSPPKSDFVRVPRADGKRGDSLNVDEKTLPEGADVPLPNEDLHDIVEVSERSGSSYLPGDAECQHSVNASFSIPGP